MYIKKPYYEKYLQNYLLKDLPGERWTPVSINDNYSISSYGRLKSLERWVPMPQIRERKMAEKIIKLFRSRDFNKHLKVFSYHLFCRLSKDGVKQTISVARLVYFHFVKEFNLYDSSLVVSPKDGNNLHIHYSNLELLTISEQKFKMFDRDRHGSNDRLPVAQYNLNGELKAVYDSILDAETQTGINSGSISTVLQNKSFSAGGSRWLPTNQIPKKAISIRLPPINQQ